MGGSAMSAQTELYACLYAREFPAQALLRLRPELHSKACVVLEGEVPSQKVCSLNTKARLRGMERGMTRVEVDTFRDPVILTRSPQSESAAKNILLECAGAFSPRVEDRSEANAFFCGIDIAGTKNLFGPPEMLGRSLLQRVRALGITASITISSNLHAAFVLARGSSPRNPVQVVAPTREAASLSSLPLTVLGLTEKQAETFGLWGIHTLGMLAALPEKELASRMGQESRRLRQLALGILPHLFQPVEPVFALEERVELDTPLEVLESLLFGMGVMLDQLILRAKARILALASVTVTLSLDGGGTHSRTVRPALPTNDKQLWIKLLHLDLEAHPPSAAILAVGLRAEPGHTSKVQLGLFSPQLPEASRLDVTLARIRAVVGEDCVGRAVLQNTHAADAFHIESFTVPTNDSDTPVCLQPRTSMRQLRPLETTSVTLQDARPATFFFRERRYKVEQCYGPWAVSGDWWNSTLWGCEQWDLVARTQDGAMLCCCMAREVLHNRWQMAALYD
jgi:protein ImuB